MTMCDLFERTTVFHAPLESKRSRTFIGRSDTSRNTLEELRNICQEIYRECKYGQKPRVIGTRKIGRLQEANSFFGCRMVDWLVERDWSESEAPAILMCRQFLKYHIIQPVYPFIKKFVNDMVLYRFTRDNLDSSEGVAQQRETVMKIAKDICAHRMRDVKARKDRHSSPTIDQAHSPKSPRSPFRFRRSSSNDSVKSSSSNSSNPDSYTAVHIAGNVLLERLGKGCDSGLMSQRMLRYAFIVPGMKASIAAADLSLKQKFYAEEMYKFSEEVVRSAGKMAVSVSPVSGTRRTSLVVAAVDRRLSLQGTLSPGGLPQQGLYTLRQQDPLETAYIFGSSTFREQTEDAAEASRERSDAFVTCPSVTVSRPSRTSGSLIDRLRRSNK